MENQGKWAGGFLMNTHLATCSRARAADIGTDITALCYHHCALEQGTSP